MVGRFQTAFDCEAAVIVRGLEIIATMAAQGESFRIFTDSQTAMLRLVSSDAPGPGQSTDRRGIRTAVALLARGIQVDIHWVPGRSGVMGNELAEMCARDESLRAGRQDPGTEDNGLRRRIGGQVRHTSCSLSYLKASRSAMASRMWRDEIIRRSGRKKVFRIPREGVKPRVPVALGPAPKELASHFFQLASGHVMIAPFLKEKFGWIDNDVCWWCGTARQTREHLFKECVAWKQEIRELWDKVGEASMDNNASGNRVVMFKGRKGFGFGVRTGKAGPGNTPVRELLADGRFSSAVLDFLKHTSVGKLKAGVLGDSFLAGRRGG